MKIPDQNVILLRANISAGRRSIMIKLFSPLITKKRRRKKEAEKKKKKLARSLFSPIHAAAAHGVYVSSSFEEEEKLNDLP